MPQIPAESCAKWGVDKVDLLGEFTLQPLGKMELITVGLTLRYRVR
jgi:hypothetical protein